MDLNQINKRSSRQRPACPPHTAEQRDRRPGHSARSPEKPLSQSHSLRAAGTPGCPHTPPFSEEVTKTRAGRGPAQPKWQDCVGSFARFCRCLRRPFPSLFCERGKRFGRSPGKPKVITTACPRASHGSSSFLLSAREESLCPGHLSPHQPA